MQSVGELAEGAAGEPGEGDELAAVGVAGELEADAGLFDDGQAMWGVVEQDAGLGGVGPRASRLARRWMGEWESA